MHPPSPARSHPATPAGPAPRSTGGHRRPRASQTPRSSARAMPRASPRGPADNSRLQKRAQGRARRKSRHGEGGQGAAAGRTLLCAPVCRMTFRSSTFPTGTRDILSPYTAPRTPALPAPPGPSRPGAVGRKGRRKPGLLWAAGRKRSPPAASSRQQTPGRGAAAGTEPRRPRGETARQRLWEQAGSVRLRRGAGGRGAGVVAGPERAGAGGGGGVGGGRREDPQSAALPVAVARRRRRSWRARRWRGPRSSGRCWTRWRRTSPGRTAGSCGSSAPRPSGSAPRRSLTCACGPVPRWVRGVWGSGSRPSAGGAPEGRSAAARSLAGRCPEAAVHQRLQLEKGPRSQGPH